MLVSLNDRWKCPCAYFLVDSVASEELANLIKKCLALLDENKINVHSITIDGLVSNFTTIKILRANLDWYSKKFQPYFLHPTTKNRVHVFPDACHMLKNIRNAFHHYRFLFDGEDKSISWQYIIDLVDIQVNQGLHTGNKLTKRHVDFKQNIMNVRIATQTLSNSTKDSLLYLQRTETYGKQFCKVNSTAIFCKQINDAFDILNVRSRYPTHFETHKIALHAGTIEELKLEVKEITDYIHSLKVLDKKSNKLIPILKSGWKTGFLG